MRLFIVVNASPRKRAFIPGRSERGIRRALTFADWDARATRLANALLDLGLTKGDRVGLLAYNCVEWMEIYVAVARAGLVAVPINFRLMPPEIAYILSHAEAKAVIVQDDLVDRLEAIRADVQLPPENYLHFGAASPKGWRSYEALIGAASRVTPAVRVRPEDPFALMYTSGTTGKPKGAIRNHEGNALIALATAVEFRFSREDTALLVMPLCHANSLYFGLTFMYLGATIVVDDHKSFDPEALLSTLAREK